jgi:hypothetical protein
MMVPRVPFSALAILIVACLSGCAAVSSDTANDPSNPYSSEYEQVLAHTDSDYVKQVLGDGEITAAEFHETIASLVACLRAGGIDPLVDELESGATIIGYPSSQEDDPAVRDCEEKWDAGILQLYRAFVENPNNMTSDDLEAMCLVQYGLAPEGFTGKDLEKLLEMSSEQTTYAMDGTIVSESPVTNPTPDLPGGVPLYGDRTEDCFHKPWQAIQALASSR